MEFLEVWGQSIRFWRRWSGSRDFKYFFDNFWRAGTRMPKEPSIRSWLQSVSRVQGRF